MLPDDSIRTGRLDDEGRARIPEVTVGPVQMVQVLFQPDNAPILATRAAEGGPGRHRRADPH